MNNFFSWKRIVIIFLVGIGIWILIPKIIGLKETLYLLSQIKYWALILALLSESFFYIGSTILTRTVLKMTSDKLTFYDVLKISIMDSFSVQFLPLGTFGEAAVDYYFYRAKNIRTAHIVLMFISRTIIVWFVFAFIYLVGVAFSPTNSELGTQKILIIWLIYFAAFGFFFYLLYLYLKPKLLLQRTLGFVNFLNFFAKHLRLKVIPLEKVPILIEKIYEAVKILFRNPRLQLEAFLGALFYWFGDIFCLYFTFIGFGYKPHLPVVIFTYAVAKILGTISFIPGGLGVIEASMSLLFIGFGVPSATALTAVLVFRLISFWLPIPLGFWSFLSLQKNYIKMKLQGFIS